MFDTNKIFKTKLYRKTNGKYREVYSAACPEGEDMRILFYINRRLGAVEFRLNLYDDAAQKDEAVSCAIIDIDHGFDIYEARFSARPKGLYFLSGHYKTLDGEGRFLFPDGEDYLPITYYSPDFSTPDSYKGGVIYQIFPDRFAKSEKVNLPVKSHAIINRDWENGIPNYAKKPGAPLDNNMFFGGSLYGIAEKLDYLKSLGVTIIYLNPIFEARTNHKYDTSDYMKVDSMFGGDEGLAHLISECKKRGIKIILDGVFNHVGDDSIYFNKRGNYPELGAYQSKDSKYYSWFDFRKFPDDYNCWWDVKILPSLKKNCTEFLNFINGKGGVIEKYLKMGIDGWRLDVADELSDDFLHALRERARSISPEALIIGEVWEDASIKIAYDSRRHYFQGQQIDSVMNYPLRTAIIDFVTSKNCELLARTATSLYLHYPECVSHVLMNILGTHDTERILSILAGDGIEEKTNDELAHYKMQQSLRTKATELLKIASFLQFTLPGIPSIYYGDEIGMEGGRDPFNRLPFPWYRENEELLEHYRNLAEMRKTTSDLTDGDFEVISADGSEFIYRRGKTVFRVDMSELSYKTI